MLYNDMYEYYQTRIFRSINFEENHNFVVGIKNINSQIKMARHNMIEHEIDSLSGILNEKKFRQHVSEILPRCNFKEFSYAMLVVEIDNFKQLTKDFGFSIGDYVLLETAKHLCLIFSNDDIIARIEENKFAIFIRIRNNSTINSDAMIHSKAEALNKAIQKKYVIENNNVELSCKIGVAIVKAENRDYDALFKSASACQKG
jgi:diguanylate cyclase (GGDEF)-like protein